MFKSIFTLLAIFIVAQLSSQNEQLNVTSNFNGFHCDGKPGLCTIDPAQRSMDSNSTLTFNSNVSVTLCINRNKLSDLEFFNLFSFERPLLDTKKSYHFDVPADLQLSNPMPTTPANESIRIHKGNYPIEITDQYFILTFSTN
ncbi:MAG: hypothetical protein R3359_04455 [Marinirhabdus sp.]|nr:hypothetical protein [Marinirhabdus sp.]